MWLKCYNCKELWNTPKRSEIVVKQIEKREIECPNCGSGNVAWVICPKYKGKIIEVCEVEKGAKLSRWKNGWSPQ
ncbi:MAG: hypothetical protein QMC77_07610 [Methanocellales archaeon]|nr:hypothetical protein [Methanocellales archaeon]